MTVISQSMVGDLLQCPAKFSFAYGDLAGHPIVPRVSALRLREGRAWGAAVQALWTHYLTDHPRAIAEAVEAYTTMLEEDAAQMREAGAYDEAEHLGTLQKMGDLLAHYCATAEPLNLIQREHELHLAFPDFSYRCHIDGVHQDQDGHVWIVEFKLRGAGRMTPLDQVQLWRQIRWYALAYGVHYGRPVRGVIVDERLNDAPKPIKLNKDRSVSATQSTTLEHYLQACGGLEVDGVRGLPTAPNPNTVDRLSRKIWQQRHEIILTEQEMRDAEVELGSAARLVSFYRDGTLAPIRNPSSLCATCSYNSICPAPEDTRLRDALYQPNEYAEGIIA